MYIHDERVSTAFFSDRMAGSYRGGIRWVVVTPARGRRLLDWLSFLAIRCLTQCVNMGDGMRLATTCQHCRWTNAYMEWTIRVRENAAEVMDGDFPAS